MKFNRIAGLAVAGLCTLGSANAFADSVAVMKIDTLGTNVDKQADYLLSVLQKEVKNSEYTLDANGSDITYTEMQMVTGCDKEGSIACYDVACETLGSPAIIFGTVKDNGDTHLIWYVNGKGIYREVEGKITDKASADKLAQKIVVGEKGKLIVTSNIPGADVFIDGKRVGMSAEFKENAQPIELVTGNYVVAVRKDGYTKEDAVKVVINADEISEIHVDMAVATDPEDIKKAVLISGYASLGVGVASLIAGSVLVALTIGDDGKFGTGSWWEKNKIGNELKNLNVDGATKGNDSGKSAALAGQVLAGVGGALTAAGIALVVTGYVYDFAGEDVDKAYSNQYLPKVNFNLSPEYQGMTMGWSF